MKENFSNNDDKRSYSVSFIDLLSRHQRKIYAYIMGLVANFNDADDIMQDTTRIMWEKYDQYTQGTDFLAWARRIAFLRVMELRKKRATRHEMSIFKDDIFEDIEGEVAAKADITDRYLDALRSCMTKLKLNDQQFLELKYHHNLNIRDISLQYNRSSQSLYRSLGRIQNLLMQCINRTVGLEETL